MTFEHSMLRTATLCLIAFGAVMVYSASSGTSLLQGGGDSSMYLKRYLMSAALGLIAYDTCGKAERTHATIVLDFGNAVNDVRSVEAEVWMDHDVVADFRREALDGIGIGQVRFTGSFPAKEGELRMKVHLADGRIPEVTRPLEVTDGATITFKLEHHLR